MYVHLLRLRNLLFRNIYFNFQIDFSNIIEKIDIKPLAENDEQEVVREVNELFADYLSINKHVFSINLPKCGHVSV